MLCGIGGVGETTLCKGLVASIKEREERVEIITRCHVSAKPLSGQTADKFIISTLGGFRKGTLVIDEASQVPHYIWCQLLGLKGLGIRFIILGDIANQLPTVSDCFQGREVLLQADAEFLRMLADANRLTLTEGKRSDNRLFDFYSKLAKGGEWAELTLPEQIQKAREEFGKPPNGHVPLFHLTISQKHRMSLIRAAQREETKAARLAGEDVIWLPPIVSSCQNKTQGLYLFRGKLLIAVATAKGAVSYTHLTLPTKRIV